MTLSRRWGSGHGSRPYGRSLWGARYVPFPGGRHDHAAGRFPSWGKPGRGLWVFHPPALGGTRLAPSASGSLGWASTALTADTCDEGAGGLVRCALGPLEGRAGSTSQSCTVCRTETNSNGATLANACPGNGPSPALTAQGVTLFRSQFCRRLLRQVN